MNNIVELNNQEMQAISGGGCSLVTGGIALIASVTTCVVYKYNPYGIVDTVKKKPGEASSWLGEKLDERKACVDRNTVAGDGEKEQFVVIAQCLWNKDYERPGLDA